MVGNQDSTSGRENCQKPKENRACRYISLPDSGVRTSFGVSDILTEHLIASELSLFHF